MHTWSYRELVIITIHDRLMCGDKLGMNAWELYRELRDVGWQCDIVSIIDALHHHKQCGALVIVDNATLPPRYCLTEDGVITAHVILQRKQMHTRRALPAPRSQ